MTPRERNALARALRSVTHLEKLNAAYEDELASVERELDWAKGQLKAIQNLAGRSFTAHTAVRYDTEQERVAARRRTWRESKQRRKALGEAAG